MISEAITKQIVDGFFSPTFWASIVTIILALINRQRSSKMHEDNIKKLNEQNTEIAEIKKGIETK